MAIITVMLNISYESTTNCKAQWIFLCCCGGGGGGLFDAIASTRFLYCSRFKWKWRQKERQLKEKKLLQQQWGMPLTTKLNTEYLGAYKHTYARCQ